MVTSALLSVSSSWVRSNKGIALRRLFLTRVYAKQYGACHGSMAWVKLAAALVLVAS